MDLNRKSFSKGLLGSLATIPWMDSTIEAAQNQAKAKSVIYLYLNGGLSHLDSFDVKPENKTVSGDAGAITTSADGIRVSKYFPLLAKQMHHIAVINSMTSTQGAHTQGNYFTHTSYEQRGTIAHPHLGAWFSKYLPKASKTMPSYVKVGGASSLGAGFFEGRHGALPIGDPSAGLQHSKRLASVSESQMERRLKLLNNFNSNYYKTFEYKIVKSYSDAYQDALNLMHSDDVEAFDLSKEPEALKQAYGQNSFGQGCLLARRLAQKGVKFIEVTSRDWDHHGNISENFPPRAQEFDRACSTLLNDLSERGLLKQTLVVVATEFGRSPNLTGNGGRNHYPKAYTCLLAGGGVKGGQAYGKTDKDGANVISHPTEVPDFNATIAYAMGFDLTKTIRSPTGRPFKVADHGRPIKAIF